MDKLQNEILNQYTKVHKEYSPDKVKLNEGK